MKKRHLSEYEAYATLEETRLEYSGNLGCTVTEWVCPAGDSQPRSIQSRRRRQARGGSRRSWQIHRRRTQMRLEFDPVARALYLRLREGEVEETLDLAERGFGTHVDVAFANNALELEFFSFEE